MRSVRIAMSRVIGSLPALVAASSLASGCSEASSSSPATLGSSAVAAEAAGGASGSSGSSSTQAAGDSAGSLPPGCQPYQLSALPVGVPAELADICSDTAEPVVSNAAARVSLTAAAGDLAKPASGTLTLAPSLRDSVHDVPALHVVTSESSPQFQAQVSALTPSADGYSFVVTWPAFAYQPIESTQFSFLAELDVGCAAGSRLVHATTVMQVCGPLYSGQQRWVADGGMCVTCYQNQP